MASSLSTCWTSIRLTSNGDPDEREEFARRYSPMVRAYLAARWRRSIDDGLVDETVQDVFVECFRGGGILERVGEDPPDEFRAFLYGVVRNVALRAERREAKGAARVFDDVELNEIATREPSLSEVFDRAWAESIVCEAAEEQRRRAELQGEEALQRVELLDLRFGDGRPIREIAHRWGIDAAILHRQYRVARAEFKQALTAVIAFHYPDSPANADRALAEVLRTLDGIADPDRDD